MTVFDTRALTRPLFTDAEFAATMGQRRGEGRVRKRRYAASWRRLQGVLFTQKLYRRLALSFWP